MWNLSHAWLFRGVGEMRAATQGVLVLQLRQLVVGVVQLIIQIVLHQTDFTYGADADQ